VECKAVQVFVEDLIRNLGALGLKYVF
jgi:hypothetical protein